MESYYQTLNRINNIQNKIVKVFPQSKQKTASSLPKENNEFNELLQEKIASPKPKSTKQANLESISITPKSKVNQSRKNVYDPHIEETSKKYNLPASLLKSIIKVESNFDPLAISHKGAQGLMQIMPGTAKELQLENPFQPLNNIDKGAKYFSNLLEKFNGDMVKALAAYNAGEGSFKNNNIPNYPETKNYIQKVMDQYLKYSGVSK